MTRRVWVFYIGELVCKLFSRVLFISPGRHVTILIVWSNTSHTHTQLQTFLLWRIRFRFIFLGIKNCDSTNTSCLRSRTYTPRARDQNAWTASQSQDHNQDVV